LFFNNQSEAIFKRFRLNLVFPTILTLNANKLTLSQQNYSLIYCHTYFYFFYCSTWRNIRVSVKHNMKTLSDCLGFIHHVIYDVNAWKSVDDTYGTWLAGVYGLPVKASWPTLARQVSSPRRLEKGSTCCRFSV
jgi:hypothetical protein